MRTSPCGRSGDCGSNHQRRNYHDYPRYVFHGPFPLPCPSDGSGSSRFLRPRPCQHAPRIGSPLPGGAGPPPVGSASWSLFPTILLYSARATTVSRFRVSCLRCLSFPKVASEAQWPPMVHSGVPPLPSRALRGSRGHRVRLRRGVFTAADLRQKLHLPNARAQGRCHHRAYPRPHTEDATPVMREKRGWIRARPSSAYRGAGGNWQEIDGWGPFLWKRRGRPHRLVAHLERYSFPGG